MSKIKFGPSDPGSGVRTFAVEEFLEGGRGLLTYYVVKLHPNDRAFLERIEGKLDELLRKDQ